MELGAVSITAGERIGSDSPKPLKTAEQAESKPEVEADAEIESEEISADRIITINVIAGEDREFNGRELWDFLHAAGLRHDQMKILSKTEGNREDGKPIFRVANIVNPGTFDAGAIDDFSTPGISMFMLLPAPINNLLAFEQMLTVARRLAEALDGQLLDSRRQEMTAQGIEQARRRIREFDMGTTGSPSVSNGI
ncbi:MAG: cell division protein ZipA [Gammaproteobacteria bacterium]|nr:cell division protein ZipA [Gammaproteobacteria bacterium]